MSAKQFTVITGPVYAPEICIIEVPGILADERLTPKLARQVAQMVIGGPVEVGKPVTVWDSEDYGYRVYAGAARKIKKTSQRGPGRTRGKEE